jgi:hypothetical protein
MESLLLKLLVVCNLMAGLPLWMYARAVDNTPTSLAAGYLIASAVIVMLVALLTLSHRQAPAN